MTSTTLVEPIEDARVDGLLSGIKWGVSRLTFSFPTRASYYEPSYGEGEPLDGFEALNATQKAAVRASLKMYASVATVKFSEISETATRHADLRLAMSDAPPTAWSYYPSVDAEGGDSWFNNGSRLYDYPKKGNYAQFTFVHE